MTLRQFAIGRLTELGYTQVLSPSRKYAKFATPAPNKTYYWVGNRSVRIGDTITESHSVTNFFMQLKAGTLPLVGASSKV
jgi:hypothetical protein